MRNAIRGLLFAVIVSLFWTPRAEAFCASDNITSAPNAYNYDWTSPDGTGHGTWMNAVYIQLHQLCGWTPWGSLTGTMRWFDTGTTYSIGGTYPTQWNWNTAMWYIHESSQNQLFRFSCSYVRPVLWHCAMDKSNGDGTWSGNGTIDLW